jgi:hypothetical protein
MSSATYASMARYGSSYTTAPTAPKSQPKAGSNGNAEKSRGSGEATMKK